MTTWLITGASSGLGRALAAHVLASGHEVVATARDTSAIDDLKAAYPETAMAVPLDVTDTSSVHAAVEAAEERFSGIDVLVNNAGYGYTAAVEEGEDEAVSRLFATNFFGPVALIKAALPGMRHRGHGLIVNISSVGARITIPGGGYYSAAKAALEGLSGSLRKEVEPLGLRVMVVEPGSFRTDFRGRSADRSGIRIDAYDEVLGRAGSSALGPQRGAPDKAAAAILRAAEAAEPPKLLLLGSDALDGFHAAAADAAHDVGRFEQLSRSTDAS
ncbi:SDR family NAD(P)-dependent oxidoreductase [Amycolatopsis rubida]|uniref:SDR family NAD(P)-dependent oxidoreductase n=1 Tax=Amycolatopsis rubida TaxID=112413 RepID=A0ABX0BZZ2_9PSEU|nr:MULTISPECIES: oxidoreductase [Amycolatopsis]MYW96164.1 SDR family NAD(P)-dependent oxidoreductase [Amycolatopsis rubida]NEC61155.1 SDR family NAD(P)-dependent oxidoreductase [Amycolatopsis rubida]OAP24320.1 3-oxoacyl-[acyl-carrier-protein] reductase FabG [Amycolatopsis sp. M39]